MNPLVLILIVVACIVIFGGGWGYNSGWHTQYPGYYRGSIGLGTIVEVFLPGHATVMDPWARQGSGAPTIAPTLPIRRRDVEVHGAKEPSRRTAGQDSAPHRATRTRMTSHGGCAPRERGRVTVEEVKTARRPVAGNRT